VGLFARDAPWLRKLFPPTTAPQVTQPGAVSDDVQLVENYQAGGQVALPPLWFANRITTNPGAGNRSIILDPNLLLPVGYDPQVWRIFFLSVFSDGDPATFSFNVQIELDVDGANPTTVQIANGVTIGATSTARVAINSTFGLTSPILLPMFDSQRCGLVMLQTSAQGVGTVSLNYSYYILRNPAGVTHYL